MQERFYESGSCVQKNCAILGVHPTALRPNCAQVLEQAASLTQCFELRPRRRSATFSAEDRPNNRQPIRLGKRQTLQKDGVHRREDRRVGAHPNRKREHRNETKPWSLAQHADGKADILQPAVEQRQAPLLAILFFGLLHAAEFALCSMARRLGRHAAPNIFSDQHGKMRLNFGIEIALDSLFADKAVQPRSKCTQPLHLMPLPRRPVGASSAPSFAPSFRSPRAIVSGPTASTSSIWLCGCSPKNPISRRSIRAVPGATVPDRACPG